MIAFDAVAVWFGDGSLNVRGTVRRFQALLEQSIMFERQGITVQSHLEELQAMNIDFDKYAIIKNGNLSLAETLKKFEGELKDWDADRKRGQQTYIDALVSVLESEKGPVSKVGAIAAAFAKLGMPVSKWGDALGKFESAISTRKDIFTSSKGRGGGLSLVNGEAEEAEEGEEGDEEESGTYVEPEEEEAPPPPPAKKAAAKKTYRR